jgi:hypothetical protein
VTSGNPKPDASVESFIHRENIKNFKKRVEASTDDAQRTTLLRLLAEEKAKAEHSTAKAPPAE